MGKIGGTSGFVEYTKCDGQALYEFISVIMWEPVRVLRVISGSDDVDGVQWIKEMSMIASSLLHLPTGNLHMT